MTITELMDAQFRAQHPILAARLEDGSARILPGGTIEGTASDGVLVALGTVYSVPAVVNTLLFIMWMGY